MAKRKTDIMIVGIGGIGGNCLEFLVRELSVSRIVVADVRETYGIQRTNVAVNGAYQMGYFPDVEFRKMDLLEDVNKNAEIIAEVDPEIILHCATELTWWAPDALLPEDKIRPIKEVAILGPWLPLHLRLAYRLMQAVHAAGINPFVVNAAYGDSVGPALKTAGLQPFVGMGNIDNSAVWIRKEVGDDQHVKARDVQVFIVGHHFACAWATKGSPGDVPPFFLKIFVDCRDVTSQYDAVKLLRNAGSMDKELGGSSCDSRVASSMCKHALALLNDSRIFTLTPSPNGLVGGYPIRLGRAGADVLLPEGITMEEAIEINLEGQRRDGIEEIRGDGTIVFPDRVVDAMKKALNFECKSFKVVDVDDVAEELKRKFNAAAERGRKQSQKS